MPNAAGTTGRQECLFGASRTAGLDLTTSAADRDLEIDRLIALGARPGDIGQTGAEAWTVLADPEGNEFYVVRPKETLIS